MHTRRRRRRFIICSIPLKVSDLSYENPIKADKICVIVSTCDERQVRWIIAMGPLKLGPGTIPVSGDHFLR
jgi:hypothetical protein